jgi:Cd2+/Zn2+-exporting ATPase
MTMNELDECRSACALEGGCGCCAREEHREEKRTQWLPWFLLGIAALGLGLLFLIGEEAFLPQLGVSLTAVLLAGHRGFWAALKALCRGKLNEGILMLIAVAACFALGDFKEAAAIALFFSLGEQLEEFASRRSRKSIAALAGIKAETALLQQDGALTELPVDQIAVGSVLLVRPHERVPLDGALVSGQCAADTAALTGESLPKEILPGEALLSGYINGSAAITMRTTALAKDSAVSRLLRMVEEATQHKGESERFLTRFAKYYTPVVMLLGALLALVPSLITGDWALWVPRGLVFLVSACPCAIVLSVPLGFFAAIGGAAKQGVLVKGSKYLEAMQRAEIAVFDKTGTLTTEQFLISEILPAAGWEAQPLLALAAALERFSSHPLGKAIAAASGDTAAWEVRELQEQPGGGVMALVRGQVVLCGSARMLAAQGVAMEQAPPAQVHLALAGEYIGAIRLESELLPDAAAVLARLKKQGFQKLVMLTGDTGEAARRVAAQCGIEEVHAGLLPGEKLAQLERLKWQGTVVYVGDGINDAPVLAAADCGVAIGNGAQAASEAADMVLLGTHLRPLLRARQIAIKAVRILRANVAFALTVKLLVILLGMVLRTPPIWLAVFADVGVMALTVLNASRLLSTHSDEVK